MRVPELKALARDHGLRNYSRMRKAELVALLQNNGTPEGPRAPTPHTRPSPPPPPTQTWEPIDDRRPRKPTQQEMDIFEQQEMSKSRLQVKSKLNKWYDWLINHVPKPIKDGASKVFGTFKDKVMGLYNRATGSTANQAPEEPRSAETQQSAEPKPFKPIELEKAFDGAYRSYRIYGKPKVDVDSFFNKVRGELIGTIMRELQTRRSVKVQTTIWIRFAKYDEKIDMPFNSLMMNVHRGSELVLIVNAVMDRTRYQIDNPALRNSRFVFDRVLHMDLSLHQLNLTRGSLYLPLPDWLVRKRAIVNPHNENDEECFKWSIIAPEALIMKHPQRISNLQKFADKYDWSSLEYPVPVKDIKKFESKNNVSVNMLAVEGRDIYIHRQGSNVGKEINLLLISENGINHHTAIKSLSRVLRSSNMKHKCKQHFCINCLPGFMQELSRDQHRVYCKNNESVRVVMPKLGSKVEFADGQYQYRLHS